MLYVDFYKECGIGFQLIGNYYLLGDGEVGHIRRLKPAVESHFYKVFEVERFDWEPIEQFMAENKKSWGKYEDWDAVASNLPYDIRTAHQTAWILLKQRKAAAVLSKSESREIRAMVARFGYRLAHLVNDSEAEVRAAVAEQGYKLDRLVNDSAPSVRRAVAEQGYALDVLCKDQTTEVRCAVVRQGYNLAEMINDKSPHVRGEVYRQGYGADILRQDKSLVVQKAIREFDANR